MRYFVCSDGSLAECVSDTPVNENDLPIVEFDELPAPFVYCSAVLIDGEYKLCVLADWEKRHAEVTHKLVSNTVCMYVQSMLDRKAIAKGFQSIDSIILCAFTGGTYEELGKKFADLRDRAFQMRDNFLAQPFVQENLEAFIAEIDALELE